jgi:hypothetical protein
VSAFIIYSPAESLAKIESLVLVPGPDISPPVAKPPILPILFLIKVPTAIKPTPAAIATNGLSDSKDAFIAFMPTPTSIATLPSCCYAVPRVPNIESNNPLNTSV